jgi:hypothetical protein
MADPSWLRMARKSRKAFTYEFARHGRTSLRIYAVAGPDYVGPEGRVRVPRSLVPHIETYYLSGGVTYVRYPDRIDCFHGLGYVGSILNATGKTVPVGFFAFGKKGNDKAEIDAFRTRASFAGAVLLNSGLVEGVVNDPVVFWLLIMFR